MIPTTDVAVTVVGDALLDRYVRGTARGLCREAPAPVVEVDGTLHAAGGAANVAVNVAALGARASLVALVAPDPAGVRLRAILRDERVDAQAVLDVPGAATTVKTRVLADGRVLVRYDEGGIADPGAGVRARLAELLRRGFGDADAVVVSDYGGGVVDGTILDALVEAAAGTGRVLVVDAKEPQRFRALHPTVVTPSYEDTARLVGAAPVRGPHARVAQLSGLGPELLGLTGAAIVAVTLDADGVLLFERERPPFHCSLGAEPVAHGIGAGDAFTAALAVALAGGADPAVAVEFAAAAAAVAAAEPGTAVCRAQALERRLTRTGKVLDAAGVPAAAAALRQAGRRVVFTNGCFDLLHGGHVSCLAQARALGDVLVVGVNDDDGVARAKGPGRPVVPLAERLRVLAALSCVDYLVPFGGDSPTGLIEGLRPDVYVKGGDYTRETLPEAPLVERLGGEVHLVDLVPERSTTRLIERLRGTPRPDH